MNSSTEGNGRKSGQRDRLFVLGYVLFLTIALLYLFRSFIFSDDMLRSGDVIGGGIFFRSFLEHSLASSGGVPQWNPFQCCGLPFVDAIHGGAYYPMTYLEIAIGVFRGFGYSFILHYLLAGVLAYWAARQMGLSRIASSLVGVSYGLSPCLISWVAPGHDGKIYVAAWFPMVVGMAERVFRNRRPSDVAWLGLAIGITILTPHLQLAYYVLWFLLAFALFRTATAIRQQSISGKEQPLRGLSLIGLAVLIGLLISAVQILPSANYILNDTSRATMYRGPAYAGQFALHAEEVVSLAVPEFCGNDVRSGPTLYWGKNSFKDNSEAASAVAVYLALLCFVLPGRKTRYFWSFVIVAVLLYALGNATPVFRWMLSIIPALSSMEAPSGASFIAIFAISVLAGMAIDGLRNTSATTPLRRKLVLSAIIIPPVIMVALDAFIRFDGEQTLVRYAQWFYPDLLSGTIGQPGAWMRAKGNLPNLSAGTYAAAITLVVAGILVWTAFSRKKWFTMLWLVPVLVATVSVRFNERFINVCDQIKLFGPTPITKTIAEQPGNWRMLEYDVGEGTLHLAYAGIQSPEGRQDRIPFEYFDLIGEYSRFHAHNPRFINLTGTRYLVVSQNSKLLPNALGPVPLDTLVNDGRQILLENRNCLPRTFLANSYQVLPSNRVCVDSVLKGGSDLRQMVFLEEQPKFRVSDSAAPAGEASLVYYGNDSISIAVSSPGNSILVLTDNYQPSWEAYGDGAELKVYRADGTFRAVEVAAGTKSIVFVCRSGWILAGKMLAYLGLLLVALLFTWRWLRRSPNKEQVGRRSEREFATALDLFA